MKYKFSNLSDDYLRNLFIESNRRHQKYLVFHLWTRGFFAEITSVVRAAIYAHQHNLQLVLDNSAFGFKYDKGWEDYFIPFCESYQPLMEEQVEIHCDPDTNKLFLGELRKHEPQTLQLGPISIQGFEEMLRFFCLMLCQPIEEIKIAATQKASELNLLGDFLAIHIRRGDKVGWEDVFYPADIYLDYLKKRKGSGLPVFVMSDDYKVIEEVEKAIAELQIDMPVRTLCLPKYRGFDVFALREKKLAYKFNEVNKKEGADDFLEDTYENAFNLVMESIIAAKSKVFVGTALSNVSLAVNWMHQRPDLCILLWPRDVRAFEASTKRLTKVGGKKPKVFGIGLSLSGNRSLHEALQKLGYRSLHYPRNYYFRTGKLIIPHETLQEYDAILDTPVALNFDHLDRQFFGAKFIYPVREKADWLAACRQFFTADKFGESPVKELCEKLYGTYVFDEKLFSEAYDRHHRRVLQHFSNRTDDLLVIDIAAPDNWKRICKFLGQPVPTSSFPSTFI